MAVAVYPINIDSRVSDFIAKPRQMLIDGKWVNAVSGKTFPTYNPATGEVLAQVAEGDKQDVDIAVKAARKAFESGPWSRMSATQRGKLIWKLGDLLEANVEQFAMLETLDNGKPLAVARAADVPLAADLSATWPGGQTTRRDDHPAIRALHA
jgi:phenylacetaldehyde dehydrogenase